MRPHIAAGISEWRVRSCSRWPSARGQAQRKASVPTKSVRLAALLGILVLMSIAVSALTIFADSNARRRSWLRQIVLRSRKRLTGWPATTSVPASLRPISFRGANAPAVNGSL